MHSFAVAEDHRRFLTSREELEALRERFLRFWNRQLDGLAKEVIRGKRDRKLDDEPDASQNKSSIGATDKEKDTDD